MRQGFPERVDALISFAVEWKLAAANTYTQSSFLPKQWWTHRHYSPKRPSRIDYISCSKQFVPVSGTITDWPYPSDHCPVVVQISSEEPTFQAHVPRFSIRVAASGFPGVPSSNSRYARTWDSNPMGHLPGPPPRSRTAVRTYWLCQGHQTFELAYPR